MRWFPFVILAACKGAEPQDSDPEPDPYLPPAWDPAPPDLACAADAGGPVLDAALANANLAREDIRWKDAQYGNGGYEDVLNDAFLLPYLRDLQDDALATPCFAQEPVAAVEHGAALGRPGTAAVRAAMVLLDADLPDAPLDPGADTTFDAALAALLDATGDEDLAVDASALPEGLGDALVPVFLAMAEVVDAWDTMDRSAPENALVLSNYGAGGGLVDTTTQPDLADPAVQEWVISDDGPRVLYGPTLRLLFALETADLDRFAGQGEGELLSIPTSVGEIRVQGAGADEPGDVGEVLFWLDTGGDDVYVHQAGANANEMPLGVHVDLGGADTYGYVEVPGPYDGDRLPSDEDGRYRGDSAYGPFSLSHVGRQGSGRFGVGLLFDLGGANDTYTSLRMSQGWAHLGVGVLVDDGGDDVYRSESGAQGAASMGIGALVDGGGSDVYEIYAHAQGFGYVQAVGILADRGDGSDRYWSDHGDPTMGGDPVYYSPQMPKTANSSFTQGAGFGRRGDTDGGFLSGGVGILSDGGGDDAYTAGVFAQGTGYWQAMGVLADAGGNDTYDAFWYVQGAAAHYAVGVVLEGGGDDVVAGTLTPRNVQLGSGHDYSIGVWVDDSGDDTYRAISLAAGASNCQGIGLFADNGGSDTYQALSGAAFGWGNHSSECAAFSRTSSPSIGLFLDGAGPDTYAWPDTTRAPADDTTFGATGSGDENEHGGAADGTGATGLRAIPE